MYGFELNYSPGKSEAMVKCFGPGASKLKTKLFVDMQGHLQFSLHGRAKHIRVVDNYKHLGTKETVCGSLLLEIKNRMHDVICTPLAFK
eukprot:11199271-Karenia_brevis.AAC.1